jgi:uncharacterized repeat protein (TIGR01451 family)
VLEDRTTPTVVDLTSPGSSGSILGAQFVQGTDGAGGSGVIQSFVRLEKDDVEQGYNTDFAYQFDEFGSHNFNRAFQLGEAALVSLNGTPYYEFVLDLNQGNSAGKALLSLDQLRIYVSPTNIDTASNNFANGYNPATGTLGGLSPSYDMNPDLSSTNFVELNHALGAGSGSPDMTLFVPVSDLGTNPDSFIYLYSQFGGHTFKSNQGDTGGAANGGFEEWANTTVETPRISTLVGPTVVLGSGEPLTDSATLVGGDNPTGTITFTLTLNGNTVHTETVSVSGNGTYTTPTGYLPTVPGTYQWVASYSGDLNNSPVASIPGDEPQRVNQVEPTIATTAGPSVVLGSGAKLTDSATLAGGDNPTGTIMFTLTLNGSTVHTESVSVTGNGTYTTPTGFLPTATGTYEWVASYSGDLNNRPVASIPGDEPQTVVMRGTTGSMITSTAGPTVVLGSGVKLTDSATLAEANSPVTGTITFTLTGPGGGVVYTDVVTVNGNGTYDTSSGTNPGGFLPTAPGTYQWVASYSGNPPINPPLATTFGDEPQAVDSAEPTISTTAGPTVTLGSGAKLTDSATLAGGDNPTGTITFALTLNGTTVHTESVSVSGNGTYTTPTGFLPIATGTYEWVASYSGDANNSPVASIAGDEPQTVDPAEPTITTTTGPTVMLGSGVRLTDSATLADGFNPTGTITFTLLVPDGGVIDTEVVPVSGNGTYTTTTGFLPTDVGIYHWKATYSGDANNDPVASELSDEPQTVNPGTPIISTTPNPSTVMLGGTLQDVANLTGGLDPTGSITFSLYAPGVDPTVGPAAYTEIVTGVKGDGTYHTTVGYVANATGTWHWVATYNGDSNNNSVSSGPLDEPVTIPSQADLVLIKQVNQTNPIFGTPVTYTLIVHNNGPDTATGVVVTDIVPVGIVFVSATPSQGSFDAASGQWTVGTLPSGATATLQITGIVATIGPITNTSSVAGMQFDPDLGNNVSSVTIDSMLTAGQVSKQLFLSSSDSPSNAAMLAAEEAIFNALLPMWVKTWDALLSLAQRVLASLGGPGNGGVAVFKGNWLGSPLVVYENPFAGQVTAVQVGTLDLLYENNTVAGLRLS